MKTKFVELSLIEEIYETWPSDIQRFIKNLKVYNLDPHDTFRLDKISKNDFEIHLSELLDMGDKNLRNRIDYYETSYPKNFSEFQNTRRVFTLKDYEIVFRGQITDESASHVFVYTDGAHICWNDETSLFTLTIDRTEYCAMFSVDELEEILWDSFAKREFELSIDEMLSDLHLRAKELLDVIQEDCSLDEVNVHKHLVHAGRIKYLLNQFEIVNNMKGL